MKCIKCGTEFEEGIFCPSCGTKAEAEPQAETSEERVDTPLVNKCVSCGTEFNDGMFCPKCGTKIGDAPKQNVPVNNAIKPTPARSAANAAASVPEKPKKKKALLLLLIPIVAVIIILIAVFSSNSGSTPQGDDEFVTMVKTGHNLYFADVTYDEAFNNFFANPTWKSYGIDETDIDADYATNVVQFDGECTYLDEDASLTCHFVIPGEEEDSDFDVYDLSINGIKRDENLKIEFILTVFIQYYIDNNIEIPEDVISLMNENGFGYVLDDILYEAGETVVEDVETPAETEMIEDTTAEAPELPALWNETDFFFTDGSRYLEIASFQGQNRVDIYINNVMVGSLSLDTAEYDAATGYYMFEADDAISPIGYNPEKHCMLIGDGEFKGMYDVTEYVSASYLIPESDSRYVTEDDLNFLDAADVRKARNEIYARHGRRFKDAELQAYFDSQDWYEGTIEPDDFSEDLLNEFEKENLKFIKAYEETLTD